jgi:gas vesicle protein
MPTFHNVEVRATVDVEFEVFCACGAHMCNKTDTRNSRNRGATQAVVEACETCIERAVEKVTEQMQERIDELKDEIERLKATSNET